MSRPLIVLLLASLFAPALQADELVVYTERREPLVKPLFERYERETGTKVRVLSDAAPVLIERIAAEGANTRADLFMAVDAGNLWQAAERGLLAPVKSPALEAAIPAYLRDPQGRWFALSQRARTIVYSTERVQPSMLSTYEDLAGPRWKGKLCLRSSKKVYNQSLVATMIERLGAERTEAIVRGWVANLATAPFADDTQLAKAVAAGQCDVGIINTYYLGRLQADEPGFPVQVFWADQGGAGAHVNVSGAGVVAASKNKAAATKFLEWLASASVQADFASINYEIPAREGTRLDPIVAAWGPFKADKINVAVAGQRQAEAVRLMDRAGWR